MDNQIGFGGQLMVTEQLGDEQILVVRVGNADVRIAGVPSRLWCVSKVPGLSQQIPTMQIAEIRRRLSAYVDCNVK